MPDPSAVTRWRRVRHAAAAVVFGLAAVVVYAPVWRAGPDAVVPVPASPKGSLVIRSDVIFQVWLVARNARTLLTAPHRLFDTEHCAPTEKSLAYGIPMVTLGALAIPAFLASGDPVLTWNATLVLFSLVGAFAMYALVLGWTGSAGAGVAAGLLYAFHPIRLGTISHPSVLDGTWTVLALLFAERLFARGRWRDAVGLAGMTILQVGASFYPLVAALLLTAPFLLWLLLRDGLARVGAARMALVLGSVALAAAWFFAPYLDAESSAGPLGRQRFFYLSPGRLAPGWILFPGWSVLALAAVALASRRRWILPGIRGDPRWALLAGAILAALVALGDHAGPLPNLHRLLASVLPGLDAVRVVVRVFGGTHLALVLFAGIGAGALIRAAGRAAPAVAALLVLASGFEMLRAPLGLAPTYRWTLEKVAADPAAVAFFAELDELGNRGPLLELPLGPSQETGWTNASRILLSLYHRRRTSTCFGSYLPAGRDELASLAARLPEPDAVEALAGMGFTTVIVPHRNDRPGSFRMLGRLGRAAEQGRGVAHVHSTDTQSAFSLEPGGAP